MDFGCGLIVVLIIVGLWLSQEVKFENNMVVSGVINPGQSRAVVTLADGQQIFWSKRPVKLKKVMERCYFRFRGVGLHGKY